MIHTFSAKILAALAAVFGGALAGSIVWYRAFASWRKTVVPPGWSFEPRRDIAPTLMLRDKEGRPLYSPQGLQGTDEELQMHCDGDDAVLDILNGRKTGWSPDEPLPSDVIEKLADEQRADLQARLESKRNPTQKGHADGPELVRRSLDILEATAPSEPIPHTAGIIRHAGIYALGKRLWNKAYVEYQRTGNKPVELMDLAVELAKISVEVVPLYVAPPMGSAAEREQWENLCTEKNWSDR